MSNKLDLELKKIKSTGKMGQRNRFELLTTQAIICVIVLLAAVMLKTFGGNLYDATRKGYVDNFEDETKVEEVLETIGDAFGLDTPEGTQNDESSLPRQQNPPSSKLPGFSENEYDNESGIGSDISSGAEDEPGDTDDDFPVSSEDSEKVYVATDLNGQEIAESVGAHVNSIILPVNGRITSPFGMRIHPVSGENRMHGGIDIGGYEGEGIRAAMSGTVSKIGEDDSFGKYVFLKHPNGMETVYAHCSKILVEDGQEIDKGEIIAEVGSTGVSNGPHCHFEVRVGGVRIDPSYLLPVSGNT